MSGGHDHHQHHQQSSDNDGDVGLTTNDSGSVVGSAVHQMYFYASARSTILFLEWTTTTWQGLLLASFGVFVAGLCYEGLNHLTQILHIQSVQLRSSTKFTNKEVKSRAIFQHMLQTFVHFLRLIFSYGLMLILMTFNVWLCMSVIFGCTLGYFLTRWHLNTAAIIDSGADIKLDNMEDCNNTNTSTLSTLRHASAAVTAAAAAAEQQLKADICH